jgi:hypothetical protein
MPTTAAPLNLPFDDVEEVKLTISAVSSMRRKLERYHERAPFVPLPGHANLTELRIATLTRVHERLSELLDDGVNDDEPSALRADRGYGG